MKVSSRAKRDRTLRKERIWGHHEKNVSADVEESWCTELSDC